MQRLRLAVEKSIIEKYLPSRVTWISPANVDAKIDVFVKCKSGNKYTLRVYIPHDFPNSCPNMVMKEPKIRIPDFHDPRSSHTHPLRNHEGYLWIRHFGEREWTCETTLYQVFVIGHLWLKEFEAYLCTGGPIEYYLRKTYMH